MGYFSGVEVPKGYVKDPNQADQYIKQQLGKERAASSEDACLRTWAVLGNNGDQVKKEDQEKLATQRFFGYFPILGFDAGKMDMTAAVSQVYSRLVAGNVEHGIKSSDRVLKDVKGHTKPVTLKTITYSEIHLTFCQKINILARSIFLYTRGLITFCQLGVVFAPFDAAVNWYYKKG